MLGEKSTYKIIKQRCCNSMLKEFRKGLSENIFIEINKINFPANKYNILALDIKQLQLKNTVHQKYGGEQ